MFHSLTSEKCEEEGKLYDLQENEEGEMIDNLHNRDPRRIMVKRNIRIKEDIELY